MDHMNASLLLNTTYQIVPEVTYSCLGKPSNDGIQTLFYVRNVVRQGHRPFHTLPLSIQSCAMFLTVPFKESSQNEYSKG